MTYNHELFIRDAINGVLIQKTNFPIELVIGDDFSTDRTLDIIKEFRGSDTISIRVLDRKRGDAYDRKRQSLGRLYNFQNIIEECTGKYIALLDGDDYWTDPTKLQKQVDFLEEHSDFSLSFHNVSLVDENSNKLKDNFLNYKTSTITSDKIIMGAILPTCSVVFRNIIDFPSNFTSVSNGDTFLFTMLAKYGKAHMHSNIENGCYRKHKEGEWSNAELSEKIKRSIHTYTEIKKDTLNKYYPIVNRVLAAKNYALVRSDIDWSDKFVSLGRLIKYLCYYALNKLFKISV